jgi:hypothetical protein
MSAADSFWAPGDDSDPNAPPVSESEVREWEETNRLQLPDSLAKALTLHNGGQVRGTDLVIEPLEYFSVLDDEQWDQHLSPDNQEEDDFKAIDRSKLVLIGDCWGCGVVLDYRSGSEPKVLTMYNDLGGVLRDELIGTLDEFIDGLRR